MNTEATKEEKEKKDSCKYYKGWCKHHCSMNKGLCGLVGAFIMTGAILYVAGKNQATTNQLNNSTTNGVLPFNQTVFAHNSVSSLSAYQAKLPIIKTKNRKQKNTDVKNRKRHPQIPLPRSFKKDNRTRKN